MEIYDAKRDKKVTSQHPKSLPFFPNRELAKSVKHDIFEANLMRETCHGIKCAQHVYFP